MSRLPALVPELPLEFRVVERDLPESERPHAQPRVVFPDYFRTMGIAIEQGREFNERDLREEIPVVMVNETLARKIFPNESPLGRHIILRLAPNDPGREREIIGVVADVNSARFSAEQPLQAYVPYPRGASFGFSLLIRAEGSIVPSTLLERARRIAEELQPNVVFYASSTLEKHLETALEQPRLNTVLLAIFALIAIILTGIGVYAVIAYSVAQRAQEIGIRQALGASKSAILQLVLGEAAPVILLGSVTGALCSILALWPFSTALQQSLGQAVSITSVVALFLTSIALTACWLPARRAARGDPLRAIGSR